MKIFKKTYFYLRYWFKRHKNIRIQLPLVDNYADLKVYNPVETNIDIPKIIWIYWEGKKSKLVEDCIQQIKELHTDYAVHILDQNNLKDFCKIDFKKYANILPQHKADIIRLDLLYHYGGFWIDASTVLNHSLDWIIELMKENKTETFTYYRAKNTTEKDYPVIENWLMATVKNNEFYKLWLDEFTGAIQMTSKVYLDKIRTQYSRPDEIFQQIGNINYLLAYVACQKVIRTHMPSICLINCDENGFMYQVKNRWVKEKILTDMAIDTAPSELPYVIKLARKERKFMEKYYEVGEYFPDSLLDFRHQKNKK